jgi:hypothetical protein
MGQFCSDIGLKSAGVLAASFFGIRTRKALLMEVRYAVW